MNGIWQLSKRGLCEESWRLGGHLVRAFLGMFLFLALAYARSNGLRTANGLPILQTQVLLTHLFLTINAIFGFSQIIVEEREAGTLDLLKLAGIHRVSILLGKTFPRFWDCLLLIAVQFPFTLLTITIGGVSWPQVIAAYLGLFAYLVLIAGIGLFASAVCDSSRGAVGLAAVLVFVYLIPLISTTVGTGWFGISDYNLQVEAIDIMQSDFSAGPWSAAVQFAVTAGCSACFLAWLGMMRTASNPLSTLFYWWKLSITQRTRERAWNRPLIWKEYRYLTGGTLRIGLRVTLFLCLTLWLMTVHTQFGLACVWVALLAVPIGIIDGTWTAIRLFSPEIQQQTWQLLATLPIDVRQIAREKTFGWLLGIMPTLVLPYVFIVLTLLFHPWVRDFGNQSELVIGSIVTGLSILAYLHLMVLFSIDWHWKSIPSTLTATCLLVFAYLNLVVPWGGSQFNRCLVFVVTGGLMIGLMRWLQARIVRKLELRAGTN